MNGRRRFCPPQGGHRGEPPRSRHQPRRAAAPTTQAQRPKLNKIYAFVARRSARARALVRPLTERESRVNPRRGKAATGFNKSRILFLLGRRDPVWGRRVRRGGSPAAVFSRAHHPGQGPGAATARRGGGRAGEGPAASRARRRTGARTVRHRT